MARINAQIAEAREDLDDTRYQHSYDMQQEGYSKLSDDANDALDRAIKKVEANADEQERVVKMMLERVKGHYEDAYGEIEKIIAHSGTVITETSNKVLGARDTSYASLPYTDENGNFSVQADEAALEISTASINIGSTQANEATRKVLDNTHERDLNSVSENNRVYTSNTSTSSTVDPSLIADEKAEKEKQRKAEVLAAMKKFINSRPSKELSKEQRDAMKALSPVQEYVYSKSGRVISAADEVHLGNYMGVEGLPTESNAFSLTTKQRNAILAALKAYGYKKGTLGVDKDEYNWTHQGELIRRSDGAILRQLTAGTQVIPRAESENLLKWANINPSSLFQVMNMPKMTGGTTTINNHYDTLLTVNGNVDKDALPGLQEILKQACEYTNKYNAREARKLGNK